MCSISEVIGLVACMAFILATFLQDVIKDCYARIESIQKKLLVPDSTAQAVLQDELQAFHSFYAHLLPSFDHICQDAGSTQAYSVSSSHSAFSFIQA